MKLSTKNGNNIDIYNISPKPKKIRAYKRKVLEECKETISILKFQTSSPTHELFTENPVKKIREAALEFSYKDDQILYESYLAECEKGKNNASLSDEDIKKHIEFLASYINGELDQVKPKLIYDDFSDEVLYRFLATSEIIIKNNSCRPLKVITSILDLPANLYMLHMFLQGHFYEFADKNIDELLALFNFKQVKSYSLANIKEMVEAGIIQDFNQTINNAQAGRVILQKATKK